MLDPALSALISKLPKAELHLHLEGSLEPEMLFALSKRNGVAIPFDSVEAVRAAYHFSNLQDFLDIYYQGAAVLQTEQDFFDLTDAYLQRAAADGVVHVEVFFDPQTHTDRGIALSTVADGILRALDAAPARYGISAHLILCFLRHLSEDAAFATLAQAEPYLPRLLGVGLDSSELGHPPSKFAKVFAAARAKGLKLFAHAGEEGPAAYVWDALDTLGIDRIDHGNRALDDPALVDRIVKDGLTLTVCPLSNLKLCVVNDMAEHPLRRMLTAGLKATVNSDDPSYFGGYIGDNYRAVASALGLSRDEIITLARNSITGSFLDDAAKAKHLAAIADVAG
jgi:adenine deaminase